MKDTEGLVRVLEKVIYEIAYDLAADQGDFNKSLAAQEIYEVLDAADQQRLIDARDRAVRNAISDGCKEAVSFLEFPGE